MDNKPTCKFMYTVYLITVPLVESNGPDLRQDSIKTCYATEITIKVYDMPYLLNSWERDYLWHVYRKGTGLTSVA